MLEAFPMFVEVFFVLPDVVDVVCPVWGEPGVVLADVGAAPLPVVLVAGAVVVVEALPASVIEPTALTLPLLVAVWFAEMSATLLSP